MATKDRQAPPAPVLLRLPSVIALTGLTRASIYRAEAHGKFPRRLKITERCSAWPAAEVHAWIAARLGQRVDAAKVDAQ